MNGTLRWTIALLTGGSVAGFIALAVLGQGFRRSFGATGNNPLTVALPLLVQAALLASVLWPQQRGLMHAVAGIVVMLAAASIWICRESAFVGAVGLAFCGLWGAFYWQTLSRP